MYLRRPECEDGLERKSGDKRAGARIDGARRLWNDGAEAAAVQAFVRTGSERSGSGREVPEVDRGGLADRNRELHPVEDIRELRANLQNVTFFDAEVAAEVGVLRRVAEAPEGAKRAFIGRKLPVGDVRECRRVQPLRGSGVEAVAVDVQWRRVVLAAEIGPVHRPRAHPRNQLRRARSVAEEIADGRGAGTGRKAYQSRALVAQIPARTPPGQNGVEHFVAQDTGGKARHLVLDAQPKLVREVIGAEGLAQIPVKGIRGATQSQILREVV